MTETVYRFAQLRAAIVCRFPVGWPQDVGHFPVTGDSVPGNEVYLVPAQSV